MDKKFDFGEHIKASLAKANKMIAWVSRNVICKDKVVMSVTWNSQLQTCDLFLLSYARRVRIGSEQCY